MSASSSSPMLMKRTEKLKYIQVLDIIDINGQKAFITEKNGIFIDNGTSIEPLDNILHQYTIEQNIFTARQTPDGGAIIGTKFGGIILIDDKGNIIQTINKEHGLSSNNALTILQSKNNLWVGTSNGIDFLKLNSPLRIMHPDGETRGTFYDIAKLKSNLFFGSNNGLYTTQLDSSANTYADLKYEMVPNSQGQVWGLNKIGDDLLMGHNKGAYQIINNEARLISELPGAWMFVETGTPNEMYVGTYAGVDIYKKVDGIWQFHKKLEGFIESSRIIISVKPNEIWVSHPYRGVYRLIHDKDYFVKKVELYDEKHGLPSNLLNYIFDINGTPYVTGKTGVYFYNNLTDKFELDEPLTKIIGSSKNVKRLYSRPNGQLWYITEDETGFLTKDSSGLYKKTTFDNLSDLFVDGFEKLFFLNDQIALVCTDQDVLSVDTKHIQENHSPQIFINKVRITATKDSVIFDGYEYFENQISYTQNDKNIPNLPYTNNAFTLDYCSPSDIDNILYSYALIEGNSDTLWSTWSQNTTKEYNNLSNGKYCFSVRAKSSNDNISTAATFKFNIKPPWYLSTFSLCLYYILAFASLAALFFIPRKKHAQEKQILTSAIQKSDANLELIKNEKLKAEINFKNSELASSTMHLVQKNETISKVRQEIKHITKNIRDTQVKKEIKKVLSLLSDDERLEEDWENFSRHFDNVHTDFLKRISISYPILTPKDKKLCAYLRMNLSTKEIAPLLNISIRGVEISRYRLRKKLNLEGNKNLNEFMMNF